MKKAVYSFFVGGWQHSFLGEGRRAAASMSQLGFSSGRLDCCRDSRYEAVAVGADASCARLYLASAAACSVASAAASASATACNGGKGEGEGR